MIKINAPGYALLFTLLTSFVCVVVKEISTITRFVTSSANKMLVEIIAHEPLSAIFRPRVLSHRNAAEDGIRSIGAVPISSKSK